MHVGGCLCGRVRYEYGGAISEISMCHCKQCQKGQGSAFAAVALILAAQFRVTRGAEHLKEFRASAHKARVFCGVCGSPLYSARDDLPDVKRLRLGTLDTPVSVQKRYHAWVSSKAEWFDLADALPHYSEFPPD